MSDEEKMYTDVEPGSQPVDEDDVGVEEARINILSENKVALTSWRDTKCGVCGRRCCSPCTADGDRSRCAKTRFRNCSVCGHSSSRHYSVRH